MNGIERKVWIAHNLSKRICEKHRRQISIFFRELQYIFISENGDKPVFTNESHLNNEEIFNYINDTKFVINDKEFPINYSFKWVFDNTKSFLEGKIDYTTHEEWEYYNFSNDLSTEYLKEISYSFCNIEDFYKLAIFDILYFCFSYDNIEWYNQSEIIVNGCKVNLEMDWLYDFC